MAEHKNFTPAEKNKTALQMLNYLRKQGLDEYVLIFTDNKCYTTSRMKHWEEYYFTDTPKNITTKKGDIYYVYNNKKPSTFNQYANDDTLTIMYEGSMLYDLINDLYDETARDKLDGYLAKYGLYLDDASSCVMTAGY